MFPLYRLISIVSIVLSLLVMGGFSESLLANDHIHSISSHSDWIEGFTLIIMDHNDVAAANQARDYVIRQGGRIAILIPPHAMLGWVPPEVANKLVGEHGIESVSRSPVALSNLKHNDDQTLAAVSFFNYVSSGSLIREMVLSKEMKGAPLVGDTLEHRKLSYRNFEENLRKTGSVLSPEKFPLLQENSVTMTGSVSVTLFFVESNGAHDEDKYTWSDSDEQNAYNRALAGLAWWSSKASAYGASVSFTPSIYNHASSVTQQGYEPILHPHTDDYLWINAIMANLGFTEGDNGDRVTAFNASRRLAYGTDWAYSVFIAYNPSGFFSSAPTTFADPTGDWFAYAYQGGPYVQMLFRNDGWSENNIGLVLTHETGHIFWACDEYCQPGHGCCGSCGACASSGPRPTVNNGNCQACNASWVPCMMHINEDALCEFTALQIGWTGIGRGAPDPGIFIEAANRENNKFFQNVLFPPINNVHRWDCLTCDPGNANWGKGLIQDFNGKDAGVHDALMVPDSSDFVAVIYGGMWSKFIQMNGINFNGNFILGYPIADRNCSDKDATCFSDSQLASYYGTSYHYQRFQGGALVLHKSGLNLDKTYEVHGAIRSKWQSLSGPDGSLGLPVSDEYAWQGNKRRSDFEGGTICFDPATNQTLVGCDLDANGPSASITSPSNGQTVTVSPFTVYGTASDAGHGDNGISSVSVNGFRASNDTANGSATANWSLAVALNQGSNPITVIAKDNSSNQNATSLSITVNYQPSSMPAPTLVSPANGATGVPVATTLNWNAVTGSAGYQVYLGTTNPPPFLTLTTSSPFTPTLNPTTTYYWKIASRDPNNGNAESPSPIWYFTTGAPVTYTISGVVTLSGTGLGGVTVNLSGTQSNSAITNGSGEYSFSGLGGGGNYTITPSLSGYNFNPSSLPFNSLASNQTANFTATPTSWVLQRSGTENILSVYFVNANDGWAVGGSGTILHTSNGGTSWQSQTGPSSNYHYYSVYFADANNGWAAGTAGGGVIIHTSNGGATWSVQYDGGGDGNTRLWWVTGVDANHLWAASSSGLLFSTSSGTSWQLKAMDPLWKVRFVSTNTGWATKIGGALIRTTNGGDTWETRYSPSGGGNILDLSVSDANVWALGTLPYFKIAHSSDSGLTWNLQDAGTTNVIRSVNFIDAFNGWAVGDGGTILSTNNGGEAWSVTTISEVYNLWDVACNPGGAWVVGRNGTILKYTGSMPTNADFTLSANPSSIDVNQGGSGASTVTVSSKVKFNSTVNLSCFNPPAGVTCDFNSSQVIPPPNGFVDSVLTVSVASGTSAETYNLQVQGTSGGLTHTADIALKVNVPAPITHTLTVASSNPSSGVSITVSPNDNNNQGSGSTPFIRTYNNNTSVTLTAPLTVGGNHFHLWQRNGVDDTPFAQTNIIMDADYTMTAVYLTPSLNPHFVLTSVNTPIRQHGQTEVVGDVILTCDVAGTFPTSSGFTVTYSPVFGIVNSNSGVFTFASGVASNARVAHVESEPATTGIAIGSAIWTPGSNNIITVSISGVAAVGDVIRISAIRVNAGESNLVPAMLVTGTVAAVPPGAFLVDSNTTASVANVQNEVQVAVTSTAIQACGTSCGTGTIRVAERFPSALTTVTEENDILHRPSAPFTKAASSGSTLLITIANVPPGVRVSWPGNLTGSDSLTSTLMDPATTSFTNTSLTAFASVPITYVVTGDSPTLGEFIDIPITLCPTVFIPAPPILGTGTAQVKLGPNAGTGFSGEQPSSKIVSFVPNPVNVPPDSIGVLQACTNNPAVMTNPQSGSTFTSSNLTFTWSEGSGATEYYLQVGTTLGGQELYSLSEGTNLSATVMALPTDGSTVYVRLRSKIGGLWSYNDYTYISCTGCTATKAVMTTPALGSTLSSSMTTFWWSASLGSECYLQVGTTVGGQELYSAGQGTNLSVQVPTLPTDGSPVYARLWTNIGGVWLYNDYTYMACSGCTATKAVMTSPLSGSALTASSVTFTWSGSLASQSYLQVGTVPGGQQIYSAGQGTNLSTQVTGLPIGGGNVYARLWSELGGMWWYSDYSYLACSGCTPTQAAMTTPAPESTLSSTMVTFTWGTSLASECYLQVGTTAGGQEIYSAGEGTNLSSQVMGLPNNGGSVYVRLWSKIGGAWLFNDYNYTACTGCTATKAVMVTPAAGSTLSSRAVTFTWSASLAAGYYLFVGTSAGGQEIYSAGQGTNLSVGVIGFPNNGSAVHVRLWSRIGGAWLFNDYTYTACTGCQ